MGVCFVDCETTGLDPDRHQIWEVALITPAGTELVWQMDVDESRADPFALEIGRYWQRRTIANAVDPADFARAFQGFTAGHHLAGAVVSFDEERLRRLLRSQGLMHRWHYHIVDCEALAAGWLGVAPPWDSSALSLAVGVDPERFARHTALGDAQWAQAMYGAVMEMER